MLKAITRVVLPNKDLLFDYFIEDRVDTRLNGNVRQWLEDQNSDYRLVDHDLVPTEKFGTRIGGYFVRTTARPPGSLFGYLAVDFVNVHEAAMFKLRWL